LEVEDILLAVVAVGTQQLEEEDILVVVEDILVVVVDTKVVSIRNRRLDLIILLQTKKILISLT
jgi:hypothetical protein